jgi:hypothetical protein
MAKSLPISATKSFFLPVRNTVVKAVGLAGAAATSVIEFFDGEIDAIATWTLINNGTGYNVGDLVTLVAGENGSSESRAIFRVRVIDNSSASSSVSASPSISLSASPSSSPSSSVSSSPSNSMSRSSSVSSSPSSSRSVSASSSPSRSVSSSPSSSLSVSSSVSASPSASVSPSTSISASPSSSISSSASSSLSGSPSPSAGAGEITSIELIYAGGGYTAGNTYATTTNGSGVSATIKVDTVSDVGVSFAKLQCVANTSAAPLEFGSSGCLTTKGVSVRISGSSAKGHIAYE